MTIIQPMLQELEREADTTRRVLERVPQEQLAWKPHPKSYRLGQLALHIAQVPGMVAELSLTSPASPPAFVQEEARTASELVPVLDQSVARATSLLGGLSDDEMTAMWRLPTPPNHESRDSRRIAATHKGWQSPYGELATGQAGSVNQGVGTQPMHRGQWCGCYTMATNLSVASSPPLRRGTSELC